MNRYLGALFLGLCLSSTALAGCGDDSSEDDGEDGGGQKAEVNETAAASTAAQSANAVKALNAGDGNQAAGALFIAAGSALSLAVPSGGSSSQAQSLDGDLGLAIAADCETACTAEGDTGECTFTDCDAGGYSLEGHMEWGNGHFSCDIDFGAGAGAAGTFDYHLVADIDYTATSIDGTLAMDGNFSGSGQEASFDVDIAYNDVQFPETGGCPTSGSISVSASIESGGQSYDATGDVTFPVDGCTG